MLFISSSTLTSREPYGVELRLDQFAVLNLEEIRTFLQATSSPVMLTVRNQRGKEDLLEELLSLSPPYFDLEYDLDPIFLNRMIENHLHTKFILSYHNFEETPIDLDSLYNSMQGFPVYTVKIAARARTSNDALRLLLFGKKHPDVSVIAMGEEGRFARILGPVVGNKVDYAYADDEMPTAPGQCSLSELVDIYHFPKLNEQTALYGLIGDPIEKSRGHFYHNRVFRNKNTNAVYVKMRVKPEELATFIPLAKELGFQGLSVTMPLKEAILPFLDAIEPEAKSIGAINTLRLNKKIVGTNTDGVGALDALGTIDGKKIVLLGAGGAARAIAFEAKARGAKVTILNRTLERAKELAFLLDAQAGSLSDLPSEYDILINCSPEPMPIDPKNMRHKTVAMDIVYSPKETAFLKEAAQRECQLVFGEEMFVNQAARQTAYWGFV